MCGDDHRVKNGFVIRLSKLQKNISHGVSFCLLFKLSGIFMIPSVKLNFFVPRFDDLLSKMIDSFRNSCDWFGLEFLASKFAEDFHKFWNVNDNLKNDLLMQTF